MLQQFLPNLLVAIVSNQEVEDEVIQNDIGDNETAYNSDGTTSTQEINNARACTMDAGNSQESQNDGAPDTSEELSLDNLNQVTKRALEK